jgi:cyanophycin synthetase
MSILLPILIDEAALVLLTEQGLSLDAVPDAGKVVFLRRVSNVSQGGDTIDVTDLVHPSIRKVAERAATMIGVDVCGVDFITTDISRPYWETNGAICEVNSRPGLSLHLVVSEGTPRDVADDVVRMLYPEGACSRIPVVAVLSETAEHEVLNAIHAAAANSGRNIGLIWPKSSSKASQSRPGLAQHHLDQMTSVILDRTLDAAIVVVSAQDIVRSGLGFDQIDLAVVPAEGRSGLTQRACELLTRVANRRVITENDPRVIAQVLEVLKGPQGGHHETSAGLGKHSARPVATKPVSIERLEESDTSDFTVLLVGDIGFGESYWQHPRAATLQPLLTTKGYQYSLKGLMGVLKGADLTIGNLEVPLASATDPGLEGRKRYLGWSNADETVAALREAGLDAVSLANNHALDCGEAGLRETIHRLEQAGIAVFGAGINSKAAGYPFVRTVAVGPVERTIVVFGCFEYRKRYGKQYNWYSDAEHPGINPITPEEIAEQISNLRETKPNPFFIVYPHWGVDYQGITNGQRACAEQLMAAGADLIIGHGAHTLQGIETVAGRPAVYGLGNFVWNTPGRYSKLNALPYGLAAAVRFRHQQDGVSVYLRLYPLLTDNSITNFQNRPVSAAQFSEVLGATQNFDASNNNVVTGLDRRGRYIEVLVNTSTNCAARNPDRLPTATALAG